MAHDETMAEVIREEVVAILAAATGPLDVGHILAHSAAVTDKQQLYNALHDLKEAGRIARIARGQYALAKATQEPTWPAPGAKEPETASPPPRTDDLAVTKPPKPGTSLPIASRPVTAAPKKKTPPASTVERTLQQLLDDTQGALDEYIYAVADPAILKPLQAARDQARLALKAHREKVNG